MSKQVQVLLSDQQMANFQLFAEREGLTVGDWVRCILLKELSTRQIVERETKLRSIRQAAQYSFPAPDIEQMLEEIEGTEDREGRVRPLR